jgi:hypothetical protein
MANKFWIGGSGIWNASNAVNWSNSSGGPGGAVPPGVSDMAIFDANSGNGVVSNAGLVNCTGINTQGFLGSFASGLSLLIRISGGAVNLTVPLPSGLISIYNCNTNIFISPGTNTGNAGGSGLTLNIGASSSNTGVNLLGPIDIQSLNVQSAVNGYTSFGSNSHNITCFGVVYLQGQFVDLGTSHVIGLDIRMDGIAPASHSLFSANATFEFKRWFGAVVGRTFSRVRVLTPFNGSSVAFFGTGYTINTLEYTSSVACALLFADGGSYTINSWQVSGSAGKLATVRPVTLSAPSRVTLTRSAGGVVNADFLDVSYVTANPANTWYAGSNSVNGGNNVGWVFAPAFVPSLSNSLFFGANF